MTLQRILPLGLAAAVAIAAAPAFAGKSAPEAADKTQGMALMSAIVSAEGALQHGVGAIKVDRPGTGNYYVTFSRSIAGCALFPASANIEGGPYAGVLVSASNVFADASIVHVNTTNTSASSMNAPFMLMVFCAQ